MATAKIVRVFQDGVYAFISASVVEAGGKNIEYLAQTPLKDDAGNLKSMVALKTDLTAALKIARDKTLPTTPLDVAGITGTVTV